MMLPLNEQLPVTLLAWSAILLAAFFLGLRLHRTLAAGNKNNALSSNLFTLNFRKPSADNAAFPAACHMQKQSVAENRSTSARREVST